MFSSPWRTSSACVRLVVAKIKTMTNAVASHAWAKPKTLGDGIRQKICPIEIGNTENEEEAIYN